MAMLGGAAKGSYLALAYQDETMVSRILNILVHPLNYQSLISTTTV